MLVSLSTNKNDVHFCIQDLLHQQCHCDSMQRNQWFCIFSFLKNGQNIYNLIISILESGIKICAHDIHYIILFSLTTD